MDVGSLTEVNGACSAVWCQLCSVVSYKRLSQQHWRDGEGDGICALQSTEEHNKVCFSRWFWPDITFVALPSQLCLPDLFSGE